MKKDSLGFIGGGRITKIFLQAFANKKTAFKSVTVYDANSQTLVSLRKLFPGITLADSAEMAAGSDYIFIALHPPVIMETLDKISTQVRPDATVISLAPKISIEKIRFKLPKVTKVVRLIPNATSFINEGYNPVCFSAGFEEKEQQSILKMLKILGYTFEVPEPKLESYAIMSAMLPTYFWFQWKELSAIGQKIGLNEKECKDSISETVSASLDLMYRSGLKPEEVMDLIPVKPIGEHEPQITEIYNTKLLGLFEKIKP